MNDAGLSHSSIARLPTASPEIPSGSVIGDYIVERKLGEGGMGSVYEAVHPIIDKRIAIKVLRHELCSSDDAIARFVQEARAVNRIRHPNIVDVFGFGQTEDGRAYLAMELLPGRSLTSWLGKSPERLTRAEACDVLVEVAHALTAAHDAGIVHRDLKPDNIFLWTSHKGIEVKLLDFGIAKLSPGGMHAPVDCTQPGTMIGTPQYIAPEQARGAPLDGRADIYSLGVVAFELFTGRPPFISDNPVEMVAKHITLQPPNASDFDPTLPDVLDRLIAAMLEKDPERRPTLARACEVLAQVRTSPASSHAVERSVRRNQATKLLSSRELAPPTIEARAKLRWWMIPAALAFVALGVRLAVALVDRGDTAEARPVDPVVTPLVPAHVEPAPAPPVRDEPVVPNVEPDPPAAVEDPQDTSEIEVDPPTPVKPAKQTPSRVRKQAPRKPPVAKPAEAVEPKQPPPPPIEQPKPRVDEDDNAIRSPFDRKKP